MPQEIKIDDLRILIASTEKTGNTWLKLLLSHVYDLPTPYLGPDFSESEADLLGRRWVTHQHFFAERRLLEWADAKRSRLLTTLRHPGDILVSLYHYCCNYASHYKDDARIARAIAADAADREVAAGQPHHVVDGELVRAVQERVMCDLNISISWIRSRRSTVVRYEDLRTDPFATLGHVTALIAPVSEDRIQRAIESCNITVLRDRDPVDSRFFRRALIGEWRSVLPHEVLRRFRDEEPFKSQLAFLGYDLELADDGPTSRARAGSVLPLQGHRFDNGVPFVPVLLELLESIDPLEKGRWAPASDTSSPKSFFDWLNAPAEEDISKDGAIPRITNLAAFVYKQRPDLQTAFPDVFDTGRLGYAGWFLRYAAEKYQLDRSFLTPIALSWLERLPGTATSSDAEDAATPGSRLAPR